MHAAREAVFQRAPPRRWPHGAVRVDRRRAAAVLTVRDDGRGFDAEAVREGMGLANMRRRAALVRGRVTFTRSRRGGTLVRLAVPLNPGGRTAGGR